MKVTGTAALITGAGSGIGRHLAVELANQGCSSITVSNQPLLWDEVMWTKQDTRFAQSCNSATYVEAVSSNSDAYCR